LPDYLHFILRFACFAIFHSLFAARRFKQLLANKRGEQPRWYRLAYNLLSLLLFCYVMADRHNSAVLYFVPGAWSLLLYAAQLVVAALLLQSLRQTDLADFLGFRQLHHNPSPPRLISSGWYGRVRHPLYFFSLLFMVLNPVMTLQWGLLIACSLMYFVIGALVEEQRLLAQFGDAYHAYQQAVPFLVPRLFPRGPMSHRSGNRGERDR